MDASRSHAKTGLVLTGGGARAAYQVGVLKAVARIRREVGAPRHNPFGVIAGTSAGAVNAAAIACHADRFDLSVAGLVNVWRHFSADQVYRADAFGVVRTGARWLTMLTIGWAIARWRRARPRSLLDNEPLGELLQRVVHLDRLPEMLESGHLSALAITASSYSSGDHVTFCQTARPFQPWLRSQRVAVPCTIGWQHLMASSAIPFVFPAVQLERGRHDEWFGDGSMRQSAPISPAVHLGAERILVVGAGRMNEPPGRQVVGDDYPSLAQIAGHALSNIFLDALAVDVERAQRINRTLALLDPKAARADAAQTAGGAGDLAEPAPGRHRGAPRALPTAAGTHHAARRGCQRHRGTKRCGAGQLPAVRRALHTRADRIGRGRHLGPTRRSGCLLQLADADRAARGARRLARRRGRADAPDRPGAVVASQGAARSAMMVATMRWQKCALLKRALAAEDRKSRIAAW